MKTPFLILLATLLGAAILFAQAPKAFKYQAIARDEAGNILTNSTINIRISMIKGGLDGEVSYSEIQKVKSDPYGMVNLVIGRGETIKGNFDGINWGMDSYYIRMEMDLLGGTDFKPIGTSQLLAVPYALYADQAGEIVDNGNNHQPYDTKKTHSATVGNNNEGNRDVDPNSKVSANDDSFLNVNIGNVGVGTSEPSAKLEVNGDLKVQGAITTNGKLILYDSEGMPREVIINPDGTWDTKAVCQGQVKDIRDNQYYKMILIGTQCWMAENINIGIRIDKANPQANNTILEKYCMLDTESYCNEYGGLYQWDEAMQYNDPDQDKQGVCPVGWHIPSDLDLKILEGTVDSQYGVGNVEWNDILWRGNDAGQHLKSTTGWHSGGNGTDMSGFSAIPGGLLHSDGNYYDVELGAYYWTSTENDDNSAWKRSIYWDRNDIHRLNPFKSSGYSVRCIKDWECGDSITDPRDGQHYGTVKIGTVCWMSQNMNIGTRIDGGNNQTSNGIIEKYCYDDLETNCDFYGGLYQWDEAMLHSTGLQGICPEGWMLGNDYSWKILEGTVDSQYGIGNSEWDGTGFRGFDAGYHLQSTTIWTLGPFTTQGDDAYGFRALPGGYRINNRAGFYNILGEGYFWTSSAENSSAAWMRKFSAADQGSSRGSLDKTFGYSVRCTELD